MKSVRLHGKERVVVEFDELYHECDDAQVFYGYMKKQLSEGVVSRLWFIAHIEKLIRYEDNTGRYEGQLICCLGMLTGACNPQMSLAGF